MLRDVLRNLSKLKESGFCSKKSHAIKINANQSSPKRGDKNDENIKQQEFHDGNT